MWGGSPSTVLAKSSARSLPQNSIVSIVRVTTKPEFTRNAAGYHQKHEQE